MDDWWTELDGAILGCVAGRGPIALAEIAGTLGISERAANSLVAMLAAQGKVRICLVDSADGRPDRPEGGARACEVT